MHSTTFPGRLAAPNASLCLLGARGVADGAWLQPELPRPHRVDLLDAAHPSSLTWPERVVAESRA